MLKSFKQVLQTALSFTKYLFNWKLLNWNCYWEFTASPFLMAVFLLSASLGFNSSLLSFRLLVCSYFLSSLASHLLDIRVYTNWFPEISKVFPRKSVPQLPTKAFVKLFWDSWSIPFNPSTPSSLCHTLIYEGCVWNSSLTSSGVLPEPFIVRHWKRDCFFLMGCFIPMARYLRDISFYNKKAPPADLVV